MSRSFQSPFMETLLEKELAISYELTRPLELEVIKNGIVFPLIEDSFGSLNGGIMREDRSFSSLAKTRRESPYNFSVTFDGWYEDPTVLEQQFNDIEFIDDEVIFLGPIPDHYGHFITEGLSRLWLYLDAKYQNSNAIYISSNESNKFLQLWNLFGLRSSQFKQIQYPVRYRSIIVPEPSIQLHRYYHDAFNETINAIVKTLPKKEPKNLFLSTKHHSYFNGKSIGEGLIESTFRKNNFDVIYPESLALDDFISMLHSAKTVTSISGTSAHNAMFMSQDSTLVCLSRSNHHHPLQIMIGEMRKINTSYVNVFLNFFRPNFGNGPFNIIASKHFISFTRFHEMQFPAKPIIYFRALLSTFLYLTYVLFLGKVILILSKITNKKKKFIFLFSLFALAALLLQLKALIYI